MVRLPLLALLATNAAAVPVASKPFELPPKLDFQKVVTSGYPRPSPDGTLFATGDMSGIYVWRFGDMKPVAQISWPVIAKWGGVTPVAISNDNTRVLMARRVNNDTIELAIGDLTEEKILTKLASHPQRCGQAGTSGLGTCEAGLGYFSADGQRVSYEAIYHDGDRIYEDTVYGLDGKVISSSVRRHRYDKTNPLMWLDERNGQQTLCRETPAGTLAVRSDNTVCSVVDCVTGKRVVFLDDCKGSNSFAPVVSWDGSRVTSTTAVWDTATGKLIRKVKSENRLDSDGWRGPDARLSDGGRFYVERREYVAAAHVQAVRVDLFDTDTGMRLARVESAVDGATSLVDVSADGSLAFMFNGGIELWRFGPGRKLPPVAARAPVAPVRPAVTAVAATAPAPSVASDVDAAAEHGSPRPNDFALVIGIEEYQSLPKADYGVRDAQTVRKHFEALGVPARNIISLEGAQATGSKLRSYLQQWLPRNVKPDSTVFVYYSGHGAPDPEKGDAYLVPWDADPMFLTTSAYPLKEFYAELAALKAKRVVVALDACFSGSGGRSVLAKGARPLVVKVDAALPVARNLVVLAAASGGEITGTLDDQAHGIFTYHFLKALSGGAKTPRALFDYLKPRVQDDARRQNREQSPTLAGNGMDAAL